MQRLCTKLRSLPSVSSSHRLLHPPPQFYHRHLHFASASRKWNLNGSLLNTSSSLSVQLPSVAALSSSRLSLLSHSPHQHINKTKSGDAMPPRHRDRSPPPHPAVVRVYTVCDESRYLIVRNVPALGCGDDLFKLFASYGDVEECKAMDAEDCEQFTDVYWIQFRLVSNARFAKRKLDESIFLGNPLQVSYAPHFETVSDTKDKLEGRKKEVLARLNPGRTKGPKVHNGRTSSQASLLASQIDHVSQHLNSNQSWDSGESQNIHQIGDPPITRVSSDQDYFPSQSMNQTVRFVREKLNKIQSSSEHLQAGPASKKARVDNRRRI